jgi:hypothetical protein
MYLNNNLKYFGGVLAITYKTTGTTSQKTMIDIFMA